MIAPSLVEELLADQQSLTAVETFSAAHDERTLAGTRYRDLIPLAAPGPGEQYAFEVELDKCSGCKACVTACHSLNGLDENETWREVGLLVPEPKRRRNSPVETRNPEPSALRARSAAFQYVTTACHHCVDPACLNGCPVLAYEKDSLTGIVRHLDDQCIGCQYCVLKCPYDVPKYNARLGIVRKCDMCASRLVAGEPPACVQACPNEAIRITKVETEWVSIRFRECGEDFLNGAPGGEYTLPTTRYVDSAAGIGRGVLAAPRSPETSSRKESDPVPRREEDGGLYLVAADARALRPQPTHWPLVLMLVLSQAAIGVCGAAAMVNGNKALLLLASGLGIASIVSSVFHLGRPLGVWRFFLGLKRSWLSREILAFGIFVPALLAIACVEREQRWTQSSTPVPTIVVFAMGLAGAFCSMMIYHDTRRTLWHWRRTGPLFFGSIIIFVAAAAFALKNDDCTLGAFVAAVAAKLLVEISILRHVTDRELTSLKKTALLVTGQFQNLALVRLLLAVAPMGVALLLKTGELPRACALLPLGLLFTGEILERSLFFRAVDAPKMPGGLSA